MVVRGGEDAREVEREQPVPQLAAAGAEVDRERRRARLVVQRAVVETAFELRHDRDEPVAVRIALAREVTVEPRDGRQGLGGERRPDPLDRLSEHGRLHVRARARLAQERDPAALQVVPHRLEPHAALVPEHDVRDEPVVRLPRQQRAQLVGRPLAVEPRPDDRVEAGVPEPLERIRMRGRDREAVEDAVLVSGPRVRLEQCGRPLVEPAHAPFTARHMRKFGTRDQRPPADAGSRTASTRSPTCSSAAK